MNVELQAARDAVPPLRRLLPAGLAIAVASLLLTAAASGDGVLPGDVAAARFIQRLTVPGAAELAWLANRGGEAPAAVVLTAAVALFLELRRRRAEALLLLATIPGRALNFPLKALADSPRPADELARIAAVDGLGFPSGHAMGAMLLYGALFLVAGRTIRHAALRRAAQGLLAGIVPATGFARVYTGAHWPSDVIGGYLWGTLVLVALLALYHVASRRGREFTG